IARRIESIVASGPHGHCLSTNETETNGGDRRSDYARSEPVQDSATNTRVTVGTNAKIRADRQREPIPLDVKPRFHRNASTRAPPGIWLMTPASVPTPSARPT